METTKDKILRLLDTLPEPYNKQSIANYDHSFYEDGVTINNNNDALGCAFDWEKSPQGADYWLALRRHLEDGDPLPEIKETKHTPTPWSYSVVEKNNMVSIHQLGWDTAKDDFEDGKTSVAGCWNLDHNAVEDAAFIVKACNSYDEMLEALKEAEKELRFHNWQNTNAYNKITAAIQKATPPVTE